MNGMSAVNGDAAVVITRVWIAEGCIVCNLCEDTCPEVFQVNERSCVVRDSAARHYSTHTARIAQAAEECPVEVIRVTRVNEVNDVNAPEVAE